MEKNAKIKRFHIISFIVVTILGNLLHFVYDWSGENAIVGAFSAVNESTWEHLKLLFYPMLFTTVIGYFTIGKSKENYICARTKGILAGLFFIVTFFYTYTGILGKNIDVINILSFFVGVFVAEYTSYKIMISKESKCNKTIAITIIILLLACFVIFTYKTPMLGIFKDPISGLYGI